MVLHNCNSSYSGGYRGIHPEQFSKTLSKDIKKKRGRKGREGGKKKEKRKRERRENGMGGRNQPVDEKIL